MISIRMQRPNLNRTAIPKTHTVIANRNLPQPVPQMEPLACPHIHHHTVIAMDRMQCSLIPHPQSIKHTTNTNKHKTLKHNWHSLRLHPINCRLFSWNIHTIKWNSVFFTSMKKFSVFQRKKKFSNRKMNHTLYWKLLSVRLYVIFNTFQLYTENCHPPKLSAFKIWHKKYLSRVKIPQIPTVFCCQFCIQVDLLRSRTIVSILNYSYYHYY